MLLRARPWLVASMFLTLAGCSAPTDGPEGDPTGVRSDRWTAAPCGTVLATYDGTAAKSNDTCTLTGCNCAGTGPYGLQYQCVELVMRHFMTHWKLRWYGNAKDLLVHATSASYYASGSPSQVAVYTNGDAAHPPVPGDMVVWTTGTYGHVALVSGVRKGYVDIIEQNVSGVTPAGKFSLVYDGKTIAARWGGTPPAGWAHAKANVGAAPDAGTDAGAKDAGAKDTGPADASSDTGPDPDAAIDDAGGDPDGGLGDPIIAPEDAGPDDAAAPAADATDSQGGCAHHRGKSEGAFAALLVVAALLAGRRRHFTS